MNVRKKKQKMDKKINARKKAQRLARQRKMRNRRVALTVCLMLAVCLVSVGGTIAWLTANTAPVTNTFTPSDINIKLEETLPANKTAKMVPGSAIAKDPKVTVVDGSEDCYLFVKIVKSATYDAYLNNYSVAPGWNQLKDAAGNNVEGVFYREVLADDANNEFYVLAGAADGTNPNGQVVVKDTVKKENMKTLIDDPTQNPTLTFTAYACQKANVADAYTAWTNIAA